MKKTIFTCSLLLLTLLFCQNNKAFNPGPGYSGIAFSSDISGSCHGTNLAAMVFLSKGNSTLYVGPNFQKRKMNLSGVQCYYQCTFSPKGYNGIQPFVFGSGIYHQSAFLGKGYVKLGDCGNGENTVDCGAVKLKTVEAYTGFGIKIQHNEHISTSWSIGAGMYNTLSNYAKYDYMMREKSSASLILKCLINYNFKK
jgi:hypothetical protein